MAAQLRRILNWKGNVNRRATSRIQSRQCRIRAKPGRCITFRCLMDYRKTQCSQDYSRMIKSLCRKLIVLWNPSTA